MTKFKKLLLMMLLVGAMTVMAGCGNDSENGSSNNGGSNNGGSGNNDNLNNGDKGNDDEDSTIGGILDDIGDDLEDGVNDIVGGDDDNSETTKR